MFLIDAHFWARAGCLENVECWVGSRLITLGQKMWKFTQSFWVMSHLVLIHVWEVDNVRMEKSLKCSYAVRLTARCRWSGTTEHDGETSIIESTHPRPWPALKVWGQAKIALLWGGLQIIRTLVWLPVFCDDDLNPKSGTLWSMGGVQGSTRSSTLLNSRAPQSCWTEPATC